jgi:putative transposase
MAASLEPTHGASARRACRVLEMPRSTRRRPPGPPGQEAVGARRHALSERSPRFGYRKMFALLKGDQWGVRRDSGRRLRQREGLQGVKNTRKRRPLGKHTTVPPWAWYPNQVWRDDFVPDGTTEGRRLKCLTVLDAYPREGLILAWARSLTAGAVVQVLPRLLTRRGTPQDVKSDTGPEFMAPQVTAWRHAHHVETHCIAPGRPWQNGHHDSFHGVFREGGLNRWLCASVQEARRLIKNWLKAYHDERPQGALAGLTPTACAAQGGGQSQQAA